MEIVLILGVVAVIILVVGVLIYNGLVQRRLRIDEAFAQIEVQLKRRWDLIPNLVETVKGYASHESETLEAVIAARNMAVQATGPAEAAQTDNVLTGALKSLFAVSEDYPDLKANQNFLELQEQLTGTEGRIAFARQAYNDSVLRFNTKIEQVPGNLFAAVFSFEEIEYFEVEDEATGPVSVEF